MTAETMAPVPPADHETPHTLAAARLLLSVQLAAEAFDEINAAALALRKTINDDREIPSVFAHAVTATLSAFEASLGFWAEGGCFDASRFINVALGVKSLVGAIVGEHLLALGAASADGQSENDDAA